MGLFKGVHLGVANLKVHIMLWDYYVIPCSAVFSQEQEVSRLLSRSHPFRTRHIYEVCHNRCR